MAQPPQQGQPQMPQLQQQQQSPQLQQQQQQPPQVTQQMQQFQLQQQQQRAQMLAQQQAQAQAQQQQQRAQPQQHVQPRQPPQQLQQQQQQHVPQQAQPQAMPPQQQQQQQRVQQQAHQQHAQQPQHAQPQVQHQQQHPQLQHPQAQLQQPQIQHPSPQINQQQQFARPQHTPSPAPTTQAQFSVPPNQQRPQTGPSPASQPGSPYVPQNYATTPQSTAAPTPPAASPKFATTQSPGLQQYNQSFTNGNVSQPSTPLAVPSPAPTPATTPGPGPTMSHGAGLQMPESRLSMPPVQPASTTPGPVTPGLATPSLAPPNLSAHGPSTPQPVHPMGAQQAAQNVPNPQYTTATMAPIGPPPPAPTTPAAGGAMGPPQKPVERPVKETEYDVTDSLAGTGVDLRAEEQALADYYAGSFSQDARTGLPANPPGSKASFYGAGWANQPSQALDGKSQEEFERELAKKQWEEAAHRMALTRATEMKTPFLEVAPLHWKAQKIAKEYGLELNSELKGGSAVNKSKPTNDPSSTVPKIIVSTKVGEGGALVTVTNSYIPHESYLSEQMALLSIATKVRIRQMIESAHMIAINRQSTSRGEVPAEWSDVAVPLKTGLNDALQEGLEAAAGVGPQPNPLKRSYDAAKLNDPNVTKNNLTNALRETARADRNLEEARLRKRLKRQNPDSAGGGTGSRAGSVAPGTPTTADADGKLLSKKELKRGAQAAKLAEASSTASANQTLNAIMGGFGRKKGKSYSWMNAGAGGGGGGGGSGASTPRTSLGGDGLATPGAKGGAAAAANDKPQQLTTENQKNRLGMWRENGDQGKNIQLRDWLAALEMDRIEVKAIQEAYTRLDEPPRTKVDEVK